jgi:RNase P subunit RPR2
VKEIDFGAYVLLRPEWINIYAQAVIRTLRAAESGLGYLPVRSILEGRLLFQPQQADGQPEEEKRLAPADEQIVLHSMEGTLLARRLCLRQGGDLVFPSYCGRERPEGPVPLQYFVSYTIHGFLDDIYATLVVCLAHCGAFHLAELWRDAADFKTVGQKKTLGIRLLRREDGRGELIAHASSVSQEEQVLFANYIHEHLNEKSTTPVERLRRYNCPNCGEPVMNRELAMERLQKSGAEAKIRCQRCDNWVPLWDDLETLFASPVARAMVEELRNLEQGELDARRKGKLLFLAVAAHILRADQKYIEVPGNQDEGIDLELEATENGRGTG